MCWARSPGLKPWALCGWAFSPRSKHIFHRSFPIARGQTLSAPDRGSVTRSDRRSSGAFEHNQTRRSSWSLRLTEPRSGEALNTSERANQRPKGPTLCQPRPTAWEISPIGHEPLRGGSMGSRAEVRAAPLGLGLRRTEYAGRYPGLTQGWPVGPGDNARLTTFPSATGLVRVGTERGIHSASTSNPPLLRTCWEQRGNQR